MNSSPWSTLLALVVVACGPAVASDIYPAPPQAQPVAIVGATLHPVSGPAIKHGMIVFEDGRITAIGDDVEVPEGSREIDGEGLHVYPGLFEAHSQMGLKEVDALRPTRDYSETGSINANASAHVSVNPDSEIIPVTRSNGVLLALTAPTGGLIAGKAAVLQLDGWTHEDLALQPDAVMVMSWPWRDPKENQTKPDQPERIKELREFFEEGRLYLARRDAGEDQQYDIRLEAMRPVLSGEMPLFVEADDLAAIRSVVAFAAEQDVKLILFGGYDAPLCADLLKAHDVPVIISAIHRRPRRRQDPYDAAYTLPQRLDELGVRYCISGSDRSRTWNARNLGYQAGTAVAYGLSEEDAIRAITLAPAEILGVADRVGSLEVGKDATLILTTGSPLETTSQVQRAWVQGRQIDLDNKQRRLYRKYSEKYERQAPDDAES